MRLLRMRYFLDGIKKNLILRKPRSGCLEGRADAGPSGPPKGSQALRMRDFLNAIDSISHTEERPKGAFRRTHCASAADLARVPIVRSVPLG